MRLITPEESALFLIGSLTIILVIAATIMIVAIANHEKNKANDLPQ